MANSSVIRTERIEDISFYVEQAMLELEREQFFPCCQLLLKKMLKTESLNFLSGNVDGWAAAVVTVIARQNLLFEKSSKLSVSMADICDIFAVSNGNVSQKAASIQTECNISLKQKTYTHPDVQTTGHYMMKSGEMGRRLMASIKYVSGQRLNAEERGYIEESIREIHAKPKEMPETPQASPVEIVEPKSLEEMQIIHEQDKQRKFAEQQERLNNRRARASSNNGESEQISLF